MFRENEKMLVNHRWEVSDSQVFIISAHNIPSPKTKALPFLQSQYWEISVIAGNIVCVGINLIPRVSLPRETLGTRLV